jgi:hypothetical protein
VEHDPKLVRAVIALPPQRWLPLNEAFPRVKASVGGSDELAALDLTARARAGQLPTAARRILTGAAEALFVLTREFWQHAEIDRPFPEAGRMHPQVRARVGSNIPALQLGQWWFFIERRAFDKLYPAVDAPRARPSRRRAPHRRHADSPRETQPSMPAAEPILPPDKPARKRRSPEHELIRQLADGIWPGGYEHVGSKQLIKKVSDALKKKNLPVPKRDVFLRALGRRKD